MARPTALAVQDFTDIQNFYAYFALCSDAGEWRFTRREIHTDRRRLIAPAARGASA